MKLLSEHVMNKLMLITLALLVISTTFSWRALIALSLTLLSIYLYVLDLELKPGSRLYKPSLRCHPVRYWHASLSTCTAWKLKHNFIMIVKINIMTLKINNATEFRCQCHTSRSLITLALCAVLLRVHYCLHIFIFQCTCITKRAWPSKLNRIPPTSHFKRRN